MAFARDISEAATRSVLWKKVLLEISQNSQENTCPRVSFFNRVVGLRPAILLNKRLWHRCFPVNFVKFLRTPFLQSTSGRLLPTYPRSQSDQYFFENIDEALDMYSYFDKILLTGGFKGTIRAPMVHWEIKTKLKTETEWSSVLRRKGAMLVEKR